MMLLKFLVWLCLFRASISVVTSITDPVQHGEGPFWSQNEQALYFVNTFQPTVYKWKYGDGDVYQQKLSGNSVGAIFPIKGEQNKFLVAGDRTLSLLSWDTRTNNSGVLKELASVDEDKPSNQFNDGKVDSSGRLWAGTLTRNPDLSVTNFGGTLYYFNGEDIAHPSIKKTNVSISNGIAWSKDNSKMYYIDSETRKVLKFDFDLLKGNICNEDVVFDLADHLDLEGIPDGMTIDEDDNLWVALFGGRSIIQINPKTKNLLRKVAIPATYVTSVVFGGPNLDILFATTSRLKLGGNIACSERKAGSVFAVEGLGVRGLPSNSFNINL